MAHRKEDQQLKATGSDGIGEKLSRRSFLEKGSTALAVTAGLPLIAAAQQTRDMSGDTHSGVNEKQPGPINKTLDSSEPNSVFPPETDSGGQPPFKYPFSYAHKRIEACGWTRQVTVRDFPLSKKKAGGGERIFLNGTYAR